jgi:hypothetical protein
VPWVRRLGALIGSPDGSPDGTEQPNDPTHALLSSHLFGFVERATHRFWQPLDRSRLRDLVRSRSNVATMSEPDRERVLRGVDELYDDYGRGPDGMLLPYLTHCYRAVVRPPALVDGATAGADSHNDRADDRGDDDGDALLIDFP